MEPKLMEFMTYLDARADAVALEQELVKAELFGIVQTDGVQLCTDISPELRRLFNAVCRHLNLVATSTRGTTETSRYRKESIEYRSMKIFTYESEEL